MMTTLVITWGYTDGTTCDVCDEHTPPTYSTAGASLAGISHGAHDGECDLCNAVRYALQERTAATPWRTESTYGRREDADRALASISRREPTNADGDAMQYRIVLEVAS